jgi:hypothetical protein
VYAFVLDEMRGGGMQRVNLDEAKAALENQLSQPIPGRKPRVTDSVVEDEMALFRAAAGSK